MNGFYLTLKSKNKKIFGEVINLGTGYEVSIKNLLNIIGCVHSNSQKFKIICKGEDLDYRTLQGWYEKTNNINTKGFLKIKSFINKLGEEDENTKD